MKNEKIMDTAVYFHSICGGCGRSGTQVEGTLPELMEKVYAGTDGDMPELVQTEVTGKRRILFGNRRCAVYRGTGLRADDQRIAHSVVLLSLRMMLMFRRSRRQSETMRSQINGFASAWIRIMSMWKIAEI